MDDHTHRTEHALFMYIWYPEQTPSGAGHAAIGLGNYKHQQFYESMPSKSLPVARMQKPYSVYGCINTVLKNAHIRNRPNLILSLPIKTSHYSEIISQIKSFFKQSRYFHFKRNNCADLCLTALNSAGFHIAKDEDYGVTTPFGIIRKLREHYNSNTGFKVIEGCINEAAKNDSFESIVKIYGVKRSSLPFLTRLYSTPYVPISILHPVMFKLYKLGLFRAGK